jgi:hypothetical protein
VPEAGCSAPASLIWREKWLLGLAFIFLWQCRIMLSLKGYGDPRRKPGAKTGQKPVSAALARRIGWSIDRAARFVPGATCLVQAMAGQRILALKGHGAEIHVGVRNGVERGFEAHAWLASGDEIVLGGTAEELGSYSTLIGARQV